MFKNVSAKYYQDNKKRLEKKLVKDVKVFLKKNKKNIFIQKNWFFLRAGLV